MLKHFLNPPNWFTSASLFCGVYSIILSTGVEGEQNFYRSALMILFAAVFDGLDGGVARLTKTGSDFGIQLDSLVDTVSFGVAPAVLLYAWGIQGMGTLGLVGAFAFALCGVFRLARFNCEADGTKHAYSQGLTITMGGATVAAAVMAHARSGRVGVEHPLGVLALTAVLSFLMVSEVPFRSLKAMRIRGFALIWFMLAAGAVLAIAVRYNLSTAFISLLGAYVVSGPAEALVRRRPLVRRGAHRSQPDDLVDEEDLDDDPDDSDEGGGR